MNSRFSLLLAYLSGPILVALVLAAFGFSGDVQQPLLGFLGDLWLVILISALPALVLALSHFLLKFIVKPAGRGRLNKAVLAALWTSTLCLAGGNVWAMFFPDSSTAPVAVMILPFVMTGAALPLLLGIYAGLAMGSRKKGA